MLDMVLSLIHLCIFVNYIFFLSFMVFLLQRKLRDEKPSTDRPNTNKRTRQENQEENEG